MQKTRFSGLMVGMPAPEFSLPSHDGKDLSLRDCRGRIVLLYFYPRDFTPRCTKQACAFRDLYGEFAKLGAVVLGVNMDVPQRHAEFAKKHHLQQHLLSDVQGTVIDAYGAWNRLRFLGRYAFCIQRCAFLIDHSGIIRRIWRGGDVRRMAREAAHAALLVQGLYGRETLSLPVAGCAS